MGTHDDTQRTQKVRRDELGGKRGDGHINKELAERLNPEKVTVGEPDPSLSGFAGLLPFGQYLRTLRLDAALAKIFDPLKPITPMVVYPVSFTMRMLVDAIAVGRTRIFDVESLAGDSLFALLSGGRIPSIDTLYRDLARCTEETARQVDELLAQHAIEESKGRIHGDRVTIDLDTTVNPVFGEPEGAAVGYNPKYHGRPSYHPILARIAETDMVIGAKLRPGDTAFGGPDVPFVRCILQRARKVAGPDLVVYMRIDIAGDCTAVMKAITEEKAHFITKARITPDLLGHILSAESWKTTDRDAFGKPTEQVAELKTFSRGEWSHNGLRVRAIAVRSSERDSGKQLCLWTGHDMSAYVILTSDFDSAPEDIAEAYDGRAGIEPLIAELKNGFGTGDHSCASFSANHVAMLLKVLVHNLMRRFVHATHPKIGSWRIDWVRRAVFEIPARIIRTARKIILRAASRPHAPQMTLAMTQAFVPALA